MRNVFHFFLAVVFLASLFVFVGFTIAAVAHFEYLNVIIASFLIVVAFFVEAHFNPRL